MRLCKSSHSQMLFKIGVLKNSDMMIYALQLKQKSTVGVLQNFRTATIKNNFGGLLLKRDQEEKMCSDPCGFKFLIFPGHIFIRP